MSFNCIKEMSGLTHLTNLTDLTLSNNQITQVQGLGTLKNLAFLSLNNNKIKKLGDMIKHLQDLPSLTVLNCSGNTFCTEKPNYKEYLIYYLKDLKYIDSQYKDSSMKITGGEDKYKLEELEEKRDDVKKGKDESVTINEKEFFDYHLETLIRYDDRVLQPTDSNKETEMITKNENIFGDIRNDFRDKVRNECNTILSKVKEDIDTIQLHIQEFNQALKYYQDSAHQKVLDQTQIYFKKKKKVKISFEAGKGGWRQEVDELLKWMETDFNRELMKIETDLMTTLSKVTVSLMKETRIEWPSVDP